MYLMERCHPLMLHLSCILMLFRKSSSQQLKLNGLILPNIKTCTLLQDNATWCNSTFCMIEHALELKTYYGILCEKDIDLVPYHLHEADWHYLQELSSLL
jgi:hypothetical protein